MKDHRLWTWSECSTTRGYDRDHQYSLDLYQQARAEFEAARAAWTGDPYWRPRWRGLQAHLNPSRVRTA